ncbi:Protein transport protein S9 plasma membrane t-SNARE [Vermiconidia calcicola]|uniref:Protein transport protein S9 plasma membrane t-SNARE n=1 Tax=Vermiconidia calcicola TaxID=1690605 RepID=A0ACC3NMB0_9PEZI|nr:Protein transport protein S9 plasma membrane t-SNARE [Vermiconidia calcicola]
MPFGLKKGEKDGALDAQKQSLFGSRSKKTSSPAPSSANPYAAAPPPPNDPYAAKPKQNPYAAQNGGMNDPYAPKQSQPPTSSFGNLSLNGNDAPPGYNRGPSPQPNRYEKSPVPAGGYGGGGTPRFQNSGSYGQTSGYGSDPYGNQQQPQQSRYGASGYGGLGRSNSQDTMSTDAGRNALFGDAPSRVAQQQQQAPPAQGYGGSGDNSYGNSAGNGDYGSQPDRELTAEEQDEQDVLAAKNEIRFIKQQDVASTRNARRIAEQAEQTGRDTLARLGAQGDRIHNTERNLDSASNQNRLAADKASELKTLNRSMFAVHVANPFTTRKREEAANAIALEKHRTEKGEREATREQAYSSAARQQNQQRDLNGNLVRKGGAGGGKSLAERAKYQFEADSEDEGMEDEIDDNLDAIHRGAKTLNALGKAMGDEIESQNKHIDRITTKTDKVDDQIALNRARLDRIR